MRAVVVQPATIFKISIYGLHSLPQPLSSFLVWPRHVWISVSVVRLVAGTALKRRAKFLKIFFEHN